MPALPPVPGVVRVRYGYDFADSPNVGTYQHFTYTGPSPSGANCLTLAQAIFDASQVHFEGVMQGACTFTSVRVTDLSSQTGGDATFSGAAAGARPGGTIPSSIAFVSDYQIERRYRGGKPRSYWPWGTDSDLASPDKWAAATVTEFIGVQGALNGIVVGQSAGSTQLSTQCSVSYYEGFASFQNPITGRWRNAPKPRTVPVIDLIVSSTGRTLLGHQRRRTV